MCGRFVSPDGAAIERAWHIGRHNNTPFRRSFNVSPTAIVPVLRLDRETRQLELATARWGLIPHWWKDARPPTFTFNARIEDTASKPMWRDALRRTRCLVPAEGWYEWQEREHAENPTAKSRRYKQPFFIHRRDARLFCFAALLSRWSSAATGEPVVSCAILTTSAAGRLAEIHQRMPVVLPDDTHAAWLDTGLNDGATAVALIRSAARLDELACHAVSTLVNDGRVDGPELTEPLGAAAGDARTE